MSDISKIKVPSGTVYDLKDEAARSALAGKAAASHTHTVSQISDFPASLPANGGNADTVGSRYSNDFLGKDYVYPTFVNYGFGADLNNYVTEYHGFVYNCVNSPIAYNYGFLDVSFFDGTGFSPSPADKGGVVLQKFSRTDNCVFTRMRVANVWSNWSRLDSESHATGVISGLVNGTSITMPLSFSPVAVLFFNAANHHVNGGFSLSLGTNQFVFTPASVSAIGSTAVRWLAFKG
ncbi:MAG: pyocin knob domain-containing protein [Oscillospiraceae bacterium]|nr:pyocin knob domain-containing protein [Oscillospiraceae bacterium]